MGQHTQESHPLILDFHFIKVKALSNSGFELAIISSFSYAALICECLLYAETVFFN